MSILALPYLGETLSLTTAVVWALAVILFKKSGESVHPIGLNSFKNLLATFLFIPTIWIFGESLFYDAPRNDYILLILSGALGIGIADTLFFMCLNKLGAGLTAVIDCFYAPSMIVLSFIFLGESMSLIQIVGVVLIISAILTATSKKASGHLSRNDTLLGVLYGFLAMVIMAVGVIMIKPILNTQPFLWVTEWRLIGGVLVLIPIVLFHKRRKLIINSVLNPNSKRVLFGGAFIGAYLSMILWLGGMKYTQVSTAAALNQTNNIFIFLFAAIILKEKMNSMKVIGISLGVIGAVLVTFG